LKYKENLDRVLLLKNWWAVLTHKGIELQSGGNGKHCFSNVLDCSKAFLEDRIKNVRFFIKCAVLAESLDGIFFNLSQK
jgi:hypothetical protein